MNILVHARVSPKLAQWLAQEAQQLGMTKANFLRALIYAAKMRADSR